MNRLKKLYSIIAITVFAVAMIVVPAQAATAPAVGVCTGTASVSPGLGLPVLTSKTFTWELKTTCTVVSADGVETLNLDASGTGTGACGLSSASGGTGTLSNGSQTINLSNIGWESVGSVLLVTGDHNTPGSVGEFVAEVTAQGGAACVDGNATSFTVVVAGEFV